MADFAVQVAARLGFIYFKTVVGLCLQEVNWTFTLMLWIKEQRVYLEYVPAAPKWICIFTLVSLYILLAQLHKFKTTKNQTCKLKDEQGHSGASRFSRVLNIWCWSKTRHLQVIATEAFD
jgi:hypothetical protein